VDAVAVPPRTYMQPRARTDVQYLRIYVRTLRQKIEADPRQPVLLLTEQGVGYRLRDLNTRT
jgi:DNA-binding response OmpR family regulator